MFVQKYLHRDVVYGKIYMQRAGVRKVRFSRLWRKEAYMKDKEYLAILQKGSDILGEAIHVVDAEGKTIIYNEAMAKLEKISVEDALGKPFRDVFSYIPQHESTLAKALTECVETRNKQQTYFNVYGKEITTINTTVPIEVDGKVIAAMEVAKDITDIKNLSDTVLELQEGALNSADNGDLAAVAKRMNPKMKQYSFKDLVGENPQFIQNLSLL